LEDVVNSCPCGHPIEDGRLLCDRCEYYRAIITPPSHSFDSKRDLALKAIEMKRMNKGILKIVVME
jgi:hypothetical protein